MKISQLTVMRPLDSQASDADRMVNHRAQANSFRETLAALGRHFIIPGDLVEHWCWFTSGFRALPKMLVIAIDIQGCMSQHPILSSVQFYIYTKDFSG